jgi:hypothetical protein
LYTVELTVAPVLSAPNHATDIAPTNTRFHRPVAVPVTAVIVPPSSARVQCCSTPLHTA